MFDDSDQLKERLAAFGGAIFLFGLAALVLFDLIWPGILLLIWITSIPVLIAEKGFVFGLWLIAQSTIWLVGLPFFAAIGLLWPGVLVLGGMSALLVAIAPPDQLDRRHQRVKAERRIGREIMQKRKRGLPVPPIQRVAVRRDDHGGVFSEWEAGGEPWDSEYEDDEPGRLSHASKN
jgi:hypothetical protein